MTAKQYLKQAFFTNQSINDSLLELERLRTIAYSIGAVDTSKDKVKTGKVSDIVGGAVPAIVDLEKEINEKIREYRVKKQEIESTIDKVADCKVRAVLLKRYIYFYKWDDIANSLNKTVQRVYQLHRAGLEEIGKLIVNYSKL